MSRTNARKWSAKVKTASTYPPKGLFKRSAQAIARGLASKRVSPKGPGSGIRMLQFFINRAGRNLSPTRRRVLERAKQIMQARRKTRSAGRKSSTRRH